MEAKNDIIVALEFGTSSIRGIAGCKKNDGSVQILGIEHEEARESILKGLIYNIDRTAQAITNIIGRLSDRLNLQIHQAYVGISGQSLHSEHNTVKRNLETIVKITPELTDQIKDNNRQTTYPGAIILDAITQEYTVGNRTVTDPQGIMGEHIEANFLNIIAKTNLRDNLEKAMRLAGLNIVAEPIIAPLALAEALLNSNEKRAGCALVDFGAGTTTVQIYKDNLLRQLIVLPIGGNSITGDLMSEYQLDYTEAEEKKRKHGIAYVAAPTEAPRQLSCSNDRAINENDLLETIGARQEEIIKNVWHIISPYGHQLLSGIICTGGGANMQDMVSAIQHFTNTDRPVKNAKSLITLAEVGHGINTPMNINLDTLIALLSQGRTNCTRALEEIPKEKLLEELQDTDLKNKSNESTPLIQTQTDNTEQEKLEEEEKDLKNEEKKPGLGKRFLHLGKQMLKKLQENTEDEEV